MPITYLVDDGTERVMVTATADVRLEDMVAFVTTLAARNAMHFPQRFDARGASLLLSAEDVRRYVPLMAQLRAAHGCARTAFIADTDVSFGMARMYATLAGESDAGFMVYRSLSEGNEYLGWHELPQRYSFNGDT